MVRVYTEKEGKIKGAKILQAYKDKTILAFSPHPDDLSISAGGFLCHLAKNNKVIPVLGFTGWRGVKGGMGKEAAVAVRENEMKKEARVLGLREPVFLSLLSYESDDRKSNRADKKTVSCLMDKWQPTVILVPSRYDKQPRHRLLTEFVLKSLNRVKKKVTVIYYETPWSLFGAEQVNLLVPLTKEVRNQKIKGVKAHLSQLARNDFVRISNAMLEYRALVLPEQLIGGFGSSLSLGDWVEAFSFETVVGKR